MSTTWWIVVIGLFVVLTVCGNEMGEIKTKLDRLSIDHNGLEDRLQMIERQINATSQTISNALAREEETIEEQWLRKEYRP